MQLILPKKALRLLRAMPQTTVFTGAELLLLSLLAFLCARLFWILAAPLGPVGDWRSQDGVAPAAAPTEILATFDPFFRLQGDAGAAVVTSLNLQLFGTREDRASGRGSAIIGTPEGQQRSYVVGEEIMPGVVLAGVTFDGITISRNGATERLYLDQSGTAPTAAQMVAEAPQATPAGQPAGQRTGGGALAREVEFQPRLVEGKVTGVTVQPRGDGTALQAAGLAPGDTIVSVNGRRITSVDEATRLASEIAGSEAELVVERSGRTMTVRVGGAP